MYPLLKKLQLSERLAFLSAIITSETPWTSPNPPWNLSEHHSTMVSRTSLWTSQRYSIKGFQEGPHMMPLTINVTFPVWLQQEEGWIIIYWYKRAALSLSSIIILLFQLINYTFFHFNHAPTEKKIHPLSDSLRGFRGLSIGPSWCRETQVIGQLCVWLPLFFQSKNVCRMIQCNIGILVINFIYVCIYQFSALD